VKTDFIEQLRNIRHNSTPGKWFPAEFGGSIKTEQIYSGDISLIAGHVSTEADRDFIIFVQNHMDEIISKLEIAEARKQVDETCLVWSKAVLSKDVSTVDANILHAKFEEAKKNFERLTS